VLGALQSFLKNPAPNEGEAATILRMVFVLTFMAQIAVAAVLVGVMMAITGRQSSGTLLAQILVVMSLVQLPLALLLSIGVSKAGGKQAALSASIMSGVLLSTPAWFLALTFLVSSTFLYIGILFAILMLYYAVGFMLCGRWAKVALQEQKSEARRKTDVGSQ
jgi:hypothetical protein